MVRLFPSPGRHMECHCEESANWRMTWQSHLDCFAVLAMTNYLPHFSSFLQLYAERGRIQYSQLPLSSSTEILRLFETLMVVSSCQTVPTFVGLLLKEINCEE